LGDDPAQTLAEEPCSLLALGHGGREGERSRRADGDLPPELEAGAERLLETLAVKASLEVRVSAGKKTSPPLLGFGCEGED